MTELTLAQLLGDTILSRHNQHVLMAIIGKTGMGKSRAALKIAYETSVYMAQQNGNDPEKYFTLDNVSIISEDEVVRVIKGIKKRNIYILDDIGTAWNSRTWNSKVNIIMNNIVQTFRTWNNLMILTVPDDEFIDKVPRNSLHYRIDMEQSNFDQGYTVGKLQELRRLYKYKKNILPYVRANGSKFVRIAFTSPPDFIVDEYEKRRTGIQQQEQEKNINELENIFADMHNKSKEQSEPKVTKKDLAFEIRRDHKAGVYGDVSLTEAIKQFNSKSSIKLTKQYVYSNS